MALQVIWDARKAAGNVRKHGVSFDEAKTVFLDPLAGTMHDPDHSDDEDRFVTVGMSTGARLLVVIHAEAGEATIRIISARTASALERKAYEEG